jgi:hypothetical protein
MLMLRGVAREQEEEEEGCITGEVVVLVVGWLRRCAGVLLGTVGCVEVEYRCVAAAAAEVVGRSRWDVGRGEWVGGVWAVGRVGGVWEAGGEWEVGRVGEWEEAGELPGSESCPLSSCCSRIFFMI